MFERIRLPGKIPDYFLRSNKSNINQLNICIYRPNYILYTPWQSTPWYTTCPIHPHWYEWGHGSSPAANSIEELINWYYSFALGVEASESLNNHISEHHPNQNKQLERVGTWSNVSKIIIWFASKTSMLHRACLTSLGIFFQRACRRWCVCHSLLSGPAPRGRASGLFPLLAAAAGWGAARLGPLPIVHTFLAPTQLPRLLQSLPARLRHQRQLRAHFAPHDFCSHFDQILRTGLCGPCLLGSTFCAQTPEVLRASQPVGMTVASGRKPWRGQNSSALTADRQFFKTNTQLCWSSQCTDSLKQSIFQQRSSTVGTLNPNLQHCPTSNLSVGTSRSIWHLGSLTAANWVSFDFNVSYSSCWGYSLINTLKLKKKEVFLNLWRNFFNTTF